MRATMGLFLTAPQTISIAYIKDTFFFHEYGRKIGLWACLYVSSPFIGPLFANFIVGATGNWRLVFWICFAICCLQLVLIVLFLDESFYNRTVADQPARGSRILRVVGVWQLKNHKGYFYSLKAAVTRFWRLLLSQLFYSYLSDSKYSSLVVSKLSLTGLPSFFYIHVVHWHQHYHVHSLRNTNHPWWLRVLCNSRWIPLLHPCCSSLHWRAFWSLFQRFSCKPIHSQPPRRV